jgi:hypothetical protein
MSTLTAEEKKARSNELAKERNRRHRELNKNAMNERRRLLYAEKNPPVEKVKTDIHVDLENLMNSVYTIIEDKSENTYIFYFNTFTTIIRLFEATDLLELLDLIATNPKQVCDVFDNSKQQNGSDYSYNTRYSFYKAIPGVLKIANITQSPEALKTYREKMEFYQYMYLEKSQTNQTDELPTYSVYLDKVKEIFGINSSKVIIIELYRELKLRDDLSQLIIVNTTRSVKADTNNYIIVLKKKVSVVINEFKTSSNYDAIKKELSTELSKRVIDYIKTRNLSKGDYLFSQKRLSPVISEINKRLGFIGGINTLRRILVSDLHNNPESTYEDKKNLAQDMRHDVKTALSIYKRKQKK